MNKKTFFFKLNLKIILNYKKTIIFTIFNLYIERFISKTGLLLNSAIPNDYL